MTVEHVTISDPQIHEPKGVSTAGINTTYVADGAGSGAWGKIGSAQLEGIAGDGGIADQHVITDGAGGFVLAKEAIYGSMVINNNGITFGMTAVADTTFNTPAQYTLMTGASFPWASETLDSVTFDTDRIIVPVDGVYLITSYFNIGQFPSTSAKLALRFRSSGVTYTPRKPTVKSSGSGAEAQLVATGLVSLLAGGYLQAYIASDASGTLLIRDANVSIHKVG